MKSERPAAERRGGTAELLCGEVPLLGATPMPMPRAISCVLFTIVPSAASYAMGGLSRSVPQISRITMGPSDDATTLPGQAILPTLYYLQETARATPPEGLGALATLLCSRGEELCTPGRDASLLPLLVPLMPLVPLLGVAQRI